MLKDRGQGITDINITTAIAVMNPCSIARLRTFINPSQKKPRRNDINPDKVCVISIRYISINPVERLLFISIYRTNRASLQNDFVGD